jgi:hypothetical protein
MAQPFGHDVPRLSWLGGKTYPQQGLSRRNRPGNAMEHAAANKINFLLAANVLAHIESQPTPVLLTDGK